MKRLYYAIRWPIGFLILMLRNLTLRSSDWGMWWGVKAIDVSLWLDEQGAQITPEQCDPSRIKKNEEFAKTIAWYIIGKPENLRRLSYVFSIKENTIRKWSLGISRPYMRKQSEIMEFIEGDLDT